MRARGDCFVTRGKGRITEQEKAQIIELYSEDGLAPESIASEIQRSEYNVKQVLKAEGLILGNGSPNTVTPTRLLQMAADEGLESVRDYDKANRLKLLNLAFEKAADLLNQGMTARDYKDLVAGIVLLVDKRRLEDGEAQKISEQRSSASSLDLEAEFQKIDKEIAKYVDKPKD